MEFERAKKILNPETSSEAYIEAEYYGGFSAKEYWKQEVDEACKIAVKAIEKQIPKKPTHEATLYKCLTCPNCKRIIDEFMEFIPDQPKIRVRMHNCKYCGQALDWSEI